MTCQSVNIEVSFLTHENHVRGLNQVRARSSLAQTQQDDFDLRVTVFELVQCFGLAEHVAECKTLAENCLIWETFFGRTLRQCTTKYRAGPEHLQ